MDTNGDGRADTTSRNTVSRLLGSIPWRQLSDLIRQAFQPASPPATDWKMAAAEDNTDPHKALCEALLQAQEEDRLRIAGDLHDSIGQNLSAVKMAIEATIQEEETAVTDGERAHRLSAALHRLRFTVEELRRIALDLHPSMLEDLGLIATLSWCSREFAENDPELDLVKQFEVSDADVPEALYCDIYRLVQEALHNIHKHAAASNVELRLRREGDSLLLAVKDDGCGFDVQAQESVGIGLFSMHARMVRSQGRLTIESTPGEGTSITFRWRLSDQRDSDAQETEPFEERRIRSRRLADRPLRHDR